MLPEYSFLHRMNSCPEDPPPCGNHDNLFYVLPQDFPSAMWLYPVAPTFPLILVSHPAGGPLSLQKKTSSPAFLLSVRDSLWMPELAASVDMYPIFCVLGPPIPLVVTSIRLFDDFPAPTVFSPRGPFPFCGNSFFLDVGAR